MPATRAGPGRRRTATGTCSAAGARPPLRPGRRASEPVDRGRGRPPAAEDAAGGLQPPPGVAPEAAEPPSGPLPGDRLNRLEAELAELRDQVAALREALGE